MNACIIFVGLPGLGKSTTVAQWLNLHKDEIFIYSTDSYIEEVAKDKGLTYSDVFKDTIKEATRYNNEQLEVAIKSGIDIFWDQTNLTVEKRATIIKKLVPLNYYVDCVCLIPPENGTVDYNEWKTRLLNRPGKTIPDFIIDSMEKSFVKPEFSEGFNSIIYLDMYGNPIEE